MTISRRAIALAWLALVIGASPSLGQNRISGSGIGDGRRAPKALPSPAAIPEPWPRLDPGAVLCGTREDLARYQARLVGDPDPAPNAPPPVCRRVQDRIQIKILEHHGPAQTKVALANAGAETGWTDTYLPPNPPSPRSPTATTAQSP